MAGSLFLRHKRDVRGGVGWGGVFVWLNKLSQPEGQNKRGSQRAGR